MDNANLSNNGSVAIDRILRPEEVARLLNERLLKADEVAGCPNVSRSYAYSSMQTGQIPTVKLGRACRVRPQDLTDFIESSLHSGVSIP